MPFIASRFNIRGFNQGETAKQYGTYIMGEFETALLATNNAWSVSETLVDVGSLSNNNKSITSELFYSSKSKEYLRVWVATGKENMGVYIVDVDTPCPSTGSRWNVHFNNLLKFTSNSSYDYTFKTFSDRLMFIFAISESYIGSDFGYDLGLKIPMSSIKGSDTFHSLQTTSFNIEYPFYGNVNPYSYTVMSDGSLFAVISRHTTSANGVGTAYNSLYMYAPDMIIPADPMDTYTCGVIQSPQSQDDFYVRENNYNEYSTSYYYAFFPNSSGSFDYRGCYYPSSYVNTYPARTSDSSNKIVTVPMSLFIIPYYQPASTVQLANNGVGLKGWTNPDYIRFVNSTYMPQVNLGVKYRNGEFMCAGKSVLICWDDNNPNPYDA